MKAQQEIIYDGLTTTVIYEYQPKEPENGVREDIEGITEVWIGNKEVSNNLTDEEIEEITEILFEGLRNI